MVDMLIDRGQADIHRIDRDMAAASVAPTPRVIDDRRFVQCADDVVLQSEALDRTAFVRHEPLEQSKLLERRIMLPLCLKASN